MWDRVNTVQQEATLGVREEEFLNDFPYIDEFNFKRNSEYVESTTDTVAGIFQPTTTWRFFQPDFAIRVTESVSFGSRWLSVVLSGLLLVFIGELAGSNIWVTPTWGLALTVLGWGLISFTYAVAARYVWLMPPMISEPDRMNHIVGLGLIAAVCGCITILANGLICVFLPVGLLFLGVVEIDRNFLAPINEYVADLHTKFIQVPIRYSLYTLLGVCGFVWYISLSIDIRVANSLYVILSGIFAVGVTSYLLSTATSRESARLNSVLATIVTALYILLLCYNIFISESIINIKINQYNEFALFLLAIGILTLWGSLWWLGVWNPEKVRRQFLSEGRPVLHRSSATMLYTILIGSVALIISAVAAGIVTWAVVQSGTTIWFGMVTVAVSLPLMYFLSGTCYQVWHLASLVRRFRSNMSPLEKTLSYNPAYPVVTMPSEALISEESIDTDQQEKDEPIDSDKGLFFAGAYADLFGEAIIVSEHTVKELSSGPLLTIITHEESHLEHRGAILQFVFAVIPVLGLIGRNILYSIYDFHYREMTADQHMQSKLLDLENVSIKNDLNVALNKMENGDTPDEVASTPGFLPTMSSKHGNSESLSFGDKLYGMFYGDFGGDAHPEKNDRVDAIEIARQLDLDFDTRPNHRAGLILAEIGYDRHERD